MAKEERDEQEDDHRSRLSCYLALVRTNYAVLLIFVLIVYWPRLMASYLVFFVAQVLRLGARLVGVECGRAVANRRILLITDYMPPQTHGIAIRSHAYAKEMRRQGHYVVVFATAYEAGKETSFDHPNIPSVLNPFNLKNRIGYTAGIKLAWYLGAYTWDTVHLVFPSLIGGFVLSCCAWRRIPTYCSHHVEMEMFSKHAPYPLDKFGLFMYDLVARWPAIYWGTLNAAPTLCFAKAHLGIQSEERLRCVPSGTHAVFTSTSDTKDERAEVRSTSFGVKGEDEKVVLMVQRLSKEKGTERVFPSFQARADGGGGIEGLLVIAGDGPSKADLMARVQALNIRAKFLGNVPHHDLPKIYRAADCFVTMSLSETYGLTSLEAQMCGCPAVMPHCDVFNEIWGQRIPKSWFYNIESMSELTAAIASAQNGRKFLQEHPVQQTWADAAKQLLGHYEECIELNKLARLQKKKATEVLTVWLRIGAVVYAAVFISLRYLSAAKRVGRGLEALYATGLMG